MLPSDSEYYRRRAAAERKLAQESTSPDIAAIHEEMAREYEELVGKREMPGMIRAFG